MSLSVFAMVLGAALLHAIWNILVKGQGDRLTIMAFISAVSGALSLLFLPFVDFPAPASWPCIWVFLIVHMVMVSIWIITWALTLALLALVSAL